MKAEILSPEEQPPAEVQAAARLVSNWFEGRGIGQWEFHNLCSRNFAFEAEYRQNLYSSQVASNNWQARVIALAEEKLSRTQFWKEYLKEKWDGLS